MCILVVMMMFKTMFTPERHLPTSGQHGPAPSGTPPPAQPPPPPQTRETQSHSAPTPLKRPMIAYAHPRRRAQAQGQALRHMDAGPSTKRSRCAYSTQGYHCEIGTLLLLLLLLHLSSHKQEKERPYISIHNIIQYISISIFNININC